MTTPADRSADVLLVGGGPASLSCAEALRDGGFEGGIVLATRELDPPYDRPPCSKGYLQGTVSREGLLLRTPDWYEERDIELRTRTAVTKLDIGARVATLGKGTVRYDRALLATGSLVRRLRLDGSALEGIHYLRAPGNTDAIRRDLEAGAADVVMVGGSYIACEVAASLAALGRRCTMVMTEEAPYATTFGPRVGAWFADRLREHGIDLVCGDPAEGFEGSGQRVQAVRTRSGRHVAADLVVMGTGAQPDVMLARAAGLELGETGGIACDATLGTSAPGVWAAGDVCEYASEMHGRRVRIEHWEVAAAHGRHVARAWLSGEPEAFAEVPYFWSDLGDWCTVESVGPAVGWDGEVLRGSFEDGVWTVLYTRDDRVVGAATVGRPDDLEEAAALMRSGRPVAG